MKHKLAASAIALVCSFATLPVMAQGAIPMSMQQTTTMEQSAPAQTPTAMPAPTPAAAMPSPAPATAPVVQPASAQATTQTATNTMPAATPAPTAAPAPAPAVATAPAPATTNTEQQGVVGPAPADKAQIVFFRPSGMGAAVSFKVREGEQELGRLGNRDYFIVTVTPGKHSYVVHSEAKDVINLEVDAGETYYVQGSMSMGFFVGHPHLALSNKTTFDSMSSKLSKTTL